jgi:hypothetical protein
MIGPKKQSSVHSSLFGGRCAGSQRHFRTVRAGDDGMHGTVDEVLLGRVDDFEGVEQACVGALWRPSCRYSTNGASSNEALMCSDSASAAARRAASCSLSSSALSRAAE